MKKIKLFSLLMALCLSIGTVWADDVQVYYEGWETHNNGGSTNDYGASAKTYGDFSFVYADAASTGSPLSGSYHAILRVKKSNTNSPYIESGALLDNETSISKIRWKAKAASDVTFKMYYKTTGDWTEGKAITSTTAKLDSVEFETPLVGPIYIKFVATVSSAPGGNRDSNVDDIAIFSPASTDPALSIDPTSYDFGDIKDKAAASHDFTISGENLEEGTLNISVTGGYTITSGAITVDANGDLSSNTITVAKNTTTSGSNGGTLKVYGAGVAEADVATATLSMNVKATFAVTAAVSVKDKNNNPVAEEDIPEGIGATINGGASYDVDAEGEDNIPLVATTISGYDFVGWTVSDDNVLAVDAAGSLTTTLTATATGVVTANFKEQSCTPLATPANVVVSGNNTANYPYSNVEISWNAVTNADKYDITIKQGEDVVESASDVVTNSYSLTKTLVVNTTYSYEIVAKSNTPATHCDSDPASANFVTGDYPAATLTLSENGATRPWGVGLKLNSVIALPTAVAAGNEVAGKVLVGWSASEVEETDVKPAYTDKGANFTMNATAVTLYAVYATETPGTPTLTKMVTGNTLANGDKIVVVANGTQYGLYQEDNGSSYVKNWSFEGTDPVVEDLSDAKKIWDVTTGPTSGKWKLGDATNGYLDNTGSTSVSVDDTGSEWTLTDLEDGTFNLTSIQKLSCRTDLTSANANLWRGAGNGGTSGTPKLLLYKYSEGESSYSGYTTSGAKAPTATVDPEEVEITAAAVVGGLIDVTYENVNQANVTVALFNDAECTEEFDGGWLTASLDANKDIVYGAEAAVSYANVRTAYIRLTAPASVLGPDPAVVVIPVEQAKKPAVFANLEELVSSDVPNGDSVTITLTNVQIKNFYIYNEKRAGVTFDVQKDNADIRIFKNDQTTIVDWAVGGTLSGTFRAKWSTYSNEWQLSPAYTWAWAKLTYEAPTGTALEDVETSVKAVKVLRDGQIFILRGDKTFNAQGQLVK